MLYGAVAKVKLALGLQIEDRHIFASNQTGMAPLGPWVLAPCAVILHAGFQSPSPRSK
jgi:hypothetical protein